MHTGVHSIRVHAELSPSVHDTVARERGMSIEEKPADHRRLRRKKPKRGTGLTCRKGTLGLGKDLAVSIVDVSEEGACLLVKEEIPTGTEVEITLTPVGVSRRLVTLATVVWCAASTTSFVIGVKFRDRLSYTDFFHLV